MVAVAGPVHQVDTVLLLVPERSLWRNARPATEEAQEPPPQRHRQSTSAKVVREFGYHSAW
jgi:hypothetical protein